MSQTWKILAVSLLVAAAQGAWAQDNPAPPAEGNPGQVQSPVPAYGQDSPQAAPGENPPLSGLDLPSLEPHATPMSYLQAGATFNESADSNVANNLGGGSFTSVSRALGTLTLHRLWSNYDLGLDYVGGVGYYDLSGQGFKSLQQANVDQKVTWKRGQLLLIDSFSYLPEGTFGGSYGSLGSQGIQSLGSTTFSSFWGGTALGVLGLAPRITNVSLGEVEESLTPKSSVTATVGYGFTHFYGNEFSGVSYIGSSQLSAQGGYNRVLTPHTQVAVVYGYQGFDFPVTGTDFHSHVVEGLYGHRISGRMDLLLGVGPQFTFINTLSAVCTPSSYPLFLCTDLGGTLGEATVKSTNLGVAAQGRLRYQFTKSSLLMTYERLQTSGGGVFAGAQSDIARISLTHPLSRIWDVMFDIGYTHNDRVQPLTLEQVTACTTSSFTQGFCPANNANSYNTGFVGAAVHRAFGRTWHGFASYQFNELAFDSSYCISSAPCNRISNRQIITLGLDWTPRPVRLD